MRRSRAAPKGDEGDDDSSPMAVGTGVTMDYSAVDNASLNVSVICPPFFLDKKCRIWQQHHAQRSGSCFHLLLSFELNPLSCIV